MTIDRAIEILDPEHWEIYDGVDEVNEACRMGMEALERTRWIPCSERMPEAGGYVVCIAKRNPFSRFMPIVARIEKNGLVNPITEQYISEITHWMPLPQPPKEEQKQ